MAFPPPPPPPPSLNAVEDAGQQLVDTITTAAADATTNTEQSAESAGDSTVTFVTALVTCVVAVVTFEASRDLLSAGSSVESLKAQFQQVQDAIRQIMVALGTARQQEQAEQDSQKGRQERHGQIMASIDKASKSYIDFLSAIGILSGSSAPASTPAPTPSGKQTERSAYSLQRLEFIINRLIPAVQRNASNGSNAVQTVGKLHRLLFQVRTTREALSQANGPARFAAMQKVTVPNQGFTAPIGAVPWMR
jgi:hypothetical protein